MREERHGREMGDIPDVEQMPPVAERQRRDRNQRQRSGRCDHDLQQLVRELRRVPKPQRDQGVAEIFEEPQPQLTDRASLRHLVGMFDCQSKVDLFADRQTAQQRGQRRLEFGEGAPLSEPGAGRRSDCVIDPVACLREAPVPPLREHRIELVIEIDRVPVIATDPGRTRDQNGPVGL